MRVLAGAGVAGVGVACAAPARCAALAVAGVRTAPPVSNEFDRSILCGGGGEVTVARDMTAVTGEARLEAVE